MAVTDIRLSERLKDFKRSLDGLTEAEAKKVLAAIKFGKPELSRTLDGGEKVYGRDVDANGMVDAAPSSMREDARMLVRHLSDEGGRRGDIWRREGLWRTVADGLGIKVGASN